MTIKKTGFAVVILAAGASKRFGSPKQLACFNGEPLILAVLKKVLACGVQPYITLGANKEIILQHQDVQPFSHLIIPIKNWQLGLSESIKQSISFVENRQLSGLVFLLADQPLIDTNYLINFLSAVEQTPESLICTEYKSEMRTIGVPAYFPSTYFAELKMLEGDQGAKKVLEKHQSFVLKCKGLLLDIDEPEDLARANSIQA